MPRKQLQKRPTRDRPRLELGQISDGPAGSSTDVGSRLRQAREAKQISLREIAATTKISVSSLEALEENEVAHLPGGIFTRGFVRSYATEVGLDPEETMRDFMAQVPLEGIVEETGSDSQSQGHDLFQSQQRMAGTVLKLVLVSLPVAGLLLFLGTRNGSPSADPVEAPAFVTEGPLRAPSYVAPPVSAVPATLTEPVSQGPLTLMLGPRDDCWVSLTIDGESVFARVMQGGERETYEADGEFILNIGDAGAFGFAINQQAGRSLGGSGEVVTARITHENYRSYVAR